jgi:hypothetical protein
MFDTAGVAIDMPYQEQAAYRQLFQGLKFLINQCSVIDDPIVKQRCQLTVGYWLYAQLTPQIGHDDVLVHLNETLKDQLMMEASQ